MSIPCSTFERGPPNLFESENIVDGGRYGGISFGGGEGDVRVHPRRTHRAGDPTVVRLSAHIYRRGHRYSGIGAGTSGAQWPDRKSPTHCHGRMDHLSSGEIGSPSSALTGKLFTVAHSNRFWTHTVLCSRRVWESYRVPRRRYILTRTNVHVFSHLDRCRLRSNRKLKRSWIGSSH